MIDKIRFTLEECLSGIRSEATILLGGFGEVGAPTELIEGLLDLQVFDLTIIANNAGTGERGLASLLRERRVRRVICSFPRSSGSVWFEERFRNRSVELELVPQGTLSERIRAAGAGIGAFYTTTGAETRLAEGKETRLINGRIYILEYPLNADVALIRAHEGDRWGNLTYRGTARNFGPTMAAAAALTIAQVTRVVELGALDPETVVTPGVYVDHVIEISESRAS